MHVRFTSCLALPVHLIWLVNVPPVYSDEPKQVRQPDATAIRQKARIAAERGLVFLQKDAVMWRNERKCSTCHHGTLTLWALNEAKSAGYAIPPETLAETAKWTKERLDKIDQSRDTRAGWSMVNTPSIYLGLMAQAVPTQQSISADELKRIAGHLLRHQETDGSWGWSSAPPKNRPPPFFESDEVATLLAFIVLGPQIPADPKSKSEVRDARMKAKAWLEKTKPSNTTQAAALQLLVRALGGESAESMDRDINQFLHRQNKDGGWGQLKDLPSDAYATGQALYALRLLGISSDRPEVVRGLSFLLATQKEDGSWPMTRRGHPGVSPSNFVVPITYFGSAWATLALMRTVPK